MNAHIPTTHHSRATTHPPAGADRQWYGSFGVSTLVHVCAIAVLGVLWTRPKDESAPPGVDTRWTAAADREVQPFEKIETVNVPAESESGGATAGPVLFEPQQTRPLPVRPPSRHSPLTAHASLLSTISEHLADTVGPRSGKPGALATGAGRGNGSGSGAGDGAGSGFFGSNATGRRFVYVVDCSTSMNHPHESEMKTRFRRLQFELIKSVSTLEPNSEFFVIFFNHEAIPMPARSLQPASPETQRRYLEWVAKASALGDTDPRAALALALSLNPDVIYFLSDGAFHKKIERELRSLRQERVAIHTFALGNPAGEDVMKAVAAANRGEYHFVP